MTRPGRSQEHKSFLRTQGKRRAVKTGRQARHLPVHALHLAQSHIIAPFACWTPYGLPPTLMQPHDVTAARPAPCKPIHVRE